MKSKAAIHIQENDEGMIEVFTELDPELTDEQRTGEEDLHFPQYIAGILVEGVGQALDRIGMERLDPGTTTLH
jgi:hypothetical protein